MTIPPHPFKDVWGNANSGFCATCGRSRDSRYHQEPAAEPTNPKSSIYLAGKIAKNDWRHDVVDELRYAWGRDYTTPAPHWPRLETAVLGRLDYVGPYFMGDDHGCGHGPNTHGCADDDGMCGGAYPTPGRDGVRDLCLSAIRQADIFFAWLDDTTAHGTLVELGYATALGRYVVVAGPELPNWSDQGHGYEEHEAGGWKNDRWAVANDLWFAFSMANRTIQENSPHAALKRLIEILAPKKSRFESPIEEAFWTATLKDPTFWRHDQTGGLTPQHPVKGLRYRLDFAMPADKVAIELDGYAYHSSPQAFTKDRERHRNLEAARWRIIRFSGAEITTDVARCVAQAKSLIQMFRAGTK
jgi:very-short-patch-repair endonuclease